MLTTKDRRALFVPYKRSESHYRDLEVDFESCGRVAEVNRKESYAFVIYKEESSVERALNDRFLREKYIGLNRRKPSIRKHRVYTNGPPTDYQVFLEGIPPDANQNDFRDWAISYAGLSPLYCVILRDQDFGVLHYANADDAEFAAREMDRRVYMGSKIRAFVNQQVLDNIGRIQPHPVHRDDVGSR